MPGSDTKLRHMFRFMDLPREVRSMIYEYLLTRRGHTLVRVTYRYDFDPDPDPAEPYDEDDDEDDDHPEESGVVHACNWQRARKPLRAQILALNRCVFDESVPVLYGGNMFYFRECRTFHRFMSRHLTYRRFIHHVAFDQRPTLSRSRPPAMSVERVGYHISRCLPYLRSVNINLLLLSANPEPHVLRTEKLLRPLLLKLFSERHDVEKVLKVFVFQWGPYHLDCHGCCRGHVFCEDCASPSKERDHEFATACRECTSATRGDRAFATKFRQHVMRLHASTETRANE